MLALAMASPKTVGSIISFRRCINMRTHPSSSQVPISLRERTLLNPNLIGLSFRQNGYMSYSWALVDGSSRVRIRCIHKEHGISTAEFSTIAPKKQMEEQRISGFDSAQGMHEIRGAFAQAQIRATFYPKFENEKSDQEVRSRMIDVVDTGKGVLEVTLKHSGSLFMYAGNHGGAFAKNSYGNLRTAFLSSG